MSIHQIPVVVGYDFSHSGHAALQRAVQLAARAPEHVLHVVCVVDPRHPIPSIASYRGVDEVYAARVQEALAFEVHAELERIEVPHRVHFFVHARIGKPTSEILSLAREVAAQLIVVGSHGLTGVERFVIGSTSEHVVREATCTVEVARSGHHPDPRPLPASQIERGRLYVAPHHYEYEDHRVQLRPMDWPLG